MEKIKAKKLAQKLLGFFYGLAIVVFVFTVGVYSVWAVDTISQGALGPELSRIFIASILFSSVTSFLWILFYRDARQALKTEWPSPALRKMAITLCAVFVLQVASGAVNWMSSAKPDGNKINKTYTLGGSNQDNSSIKYEFNVSTISAQILPTTQGSATLLLAALLFLLSESFRTNHQLREELDLVV